MSEGIKVAEVTIEWWPIENITPYELNVKKHEKEQVTRIAAAIQRSGRFDVPIVVDRHGVIIKGHGRRLAALELGMKRVPVICHKDISPEQARAMRLSDNRVAIGDIDTDMLRLELSDLDAELLGGVFDAKELDFHTADLGEINAEAFVDDMDEVVSEQKADLAERHEAAVKSRVPLHKAFGFKDVSAATQLLISQLMSRAESSTGKSGEEALASYLESAA